MVSWEHLGQPPRIHSVATAFSPNCREGGLHFRIAALLGHLLKLRFCRGRRLIAASPVPNGAGWDIFTTPYGAPGNARHLANAGKVGLGSVSGGILPQTSTSTAFLTVVTIFTVSQRPRPFHSPTAHLTHWAWQRFKQTRLAQRWITTTCCCVPTTAADCKRSRLRARNFTIWLGGFGGSESVGVLQWSCRTADRCRGGSR